MNLNWLWLGFVVGAAAPACVRFTLFLLGIREIPLRPLAAPPGGPA